MEFQKKPIGVFIAIFLLGFSSIVCIGTPTPTPGTPTATPVPTGHNRATVSGRSGTAGSGLPVGLPVMCGEGVFGNVEIPAGSFVVPQSIDLEIECFDEDSKEAEALAHDVEDQFDPEDDLLGAITLRPSPFVFQEDVTLIIPLLKRRKDLVGHQVRLFIYAPQQPKPKFKDIGDATVLAGGWMAEGKTDHFTTFVLIGPEKPVVADTPTVAAPVPPTDTPVPPTDTPMPPTDTPTPVPTDTPTPVPTDTPTPVPPITEVPVVGENLISNGSFEQNPEILWFVDRRNTDLSAGWSTERARTGTRSLSLSASKSGQQGWPGWFSTNTITIIEGYTYTFYAWAFTSDGAGAWISVDLLDANGRFLLGRSTGCPSSPTLGNWQMRSVNVATSDVPGATQVRLGLQQCLNFTEGSVTTLFYDDVFFGILPPSDTATLTPRVLAEFAYNELGARTAATIHDGSTSSVLLTMEFEDAFQELGGTITFPGKVNVGDTDMQPLLTGIAVHPPDVLYFPIPKPESDFIAAQSVEVPGLEDTTLMDADGLR